MPDKKRASCDAEALALEATALFVFAIVCWVHAGRKHDLAASIKQSLHTYITGAKQSYHTRKEEAILKTYRVAVKRTIEAPAESVYKVVTDMEEHRRILPKQFESLVVLQGGRGPGTVFRLNMNVMGTRTSNEMTVTEPEPGRVIREQDEAAGLTTSWTLIPSADGKRCAIELMTEFRSKPGLAGALERLISVPIIRSIYRRELENINVYLTTGVAAR